MTTPTEPAVVVVEPILTEPPLISTERTKISSPIGWSAIFAGAVVTIGAWLVLHLIGIGVGLTVIDPHDANTLRGAGIGVGIWSLIAPLVALFFGGLVAGRVAPTINTANAAIHGAVVWALAAISALVLVLMMMSSLMRGAAATGSAMGHAAGSVIGAVPSLSELGITGDDLIAPINRRLASEGKPELSAREVEAAARDALGVSMRQGRLDRATLVQSVERRTQLSRADAEEIADRVEQRYIEVRGQARELGENVKETALQVAETTGKLILVLSITGLLGLGAAVLGAVLSVRRERRTHVVLPRASMRRAG